MLASFSSVISERSSERFLSLRSIGIGTGFGGGDVVGFVFGVVGLDFGEVGLDFVGVDSG